MYERFCSVQDLLACPRGGVILSVFCQRSDEISGLVAESSVGFYDEGDELGVLSFAFFLVEALFEFGLSFSSDSSILCHFFLFFSQMFFKLFQMCNYYLSSLKCPFLSNKL